jgi:hypothetical protein
MASRQHPTFLALISVAVGCLLLLLVRTSSAAKDDSTFLSPIIHHLLC